MNLKKNVLNYPFDAIAKSAKDFKKPCYVVGGYVRDILYKKEFCLINLYQYFIDNH